MIKKYLVPFSIGMTWATTTFIVIAPGFLEALMSLIIFSILVTVLVNQTFDKKHLGESGVETWFVGLSSGCAISLLGVMLINVWFILPMLFVDGLTYYIIIWRKEK